MDIMPKKLSAFAAGLLVAIAITWLVVLADRVAAQKSVEAIDQATEPIPMDNKRLGKLLKKHFSEALFLQNGPSVWVVQITSDEETKQATKESDDAEEVAEEESPAEDKALNAGNLDGKLLVVTDERANRMRIMMPIQSFDPEKGEDLKTALIALSANYDRALDARYAVSEGILWAAFIHPLRSLTKEDLASALEQVQTLRKNTGTTYSSGALIFGPAIKGDPDKGKDVVKKRKDRSV